MKIISILIELRFSKLFFIYLYLGVVNQKAIPASYTVLSVACAWHVPAICRSLLFLLPCTAAGTVAYCAVLLFSWYRRVTAQANKNGAQTNNFATSQRSRDHMGNQGSIEPIPYEVELNWKKIESNGTPPCPREAHIAVFIAGKLYIYGGGCGSTQYSDLFSLDVAEGSWTEHQVAEGKVAPPKSTGACAAAVGNSIYIFGGLNMEQEWLDELFIFNTGKKLLR